MRITRNLILTILMALTASVSVAKEKTDVKYLAGAVPEENGIIVFRKNFTVQDMDEKEMRDILKTCTEEIVSASIKGVRSRLISDGTEDGTIVAKIEEYMVFSNKFLNLDRTRFRYQISGSVEGNKVRLQLSQISYYYNENMDGEGGITYKAEEWISDKEAVSSSGKKLYPRSKKFRIKTIDRVEEIFNGYMDRFDKNYDKETGQKKRTGVVEE